MSGIPLRSGDRYAYIRPDGTYGPLRHDPCSAAMDYAGAKFVAVARIRGNREVGRHRVRVTYKDGVCVAAEVVE